MAAEFEEKLTELAQLKPNWAGESSEAPSQANIDFLRVILIGIPPEFPLPNVRAGFNGELICTWAEYEVYATLDLDDELEVSYVMENMEYSTTYENTQSADEMRELILKRLRKVSQRIKT
ncbi:MAG: hypothetical protein ACOVQN_02925 [Exiguobacterium sp.]